MNAIQELIPAAEQSMKDIGLTSGYIESIGRTWSAFEKWLDSNQMEYSPDVGDRFLFETYGIDRETTGRLSASNKKRKRAINILRNCYEHVPYFRVEERRYETFFDDRYKKAFTAFLDSISRDYSDATLCGYVYTLNRLSRFLVGLDIADVGVINAAIIIGFLEDTAASGVSQVTVYMTSSRLRRVTAWLGENNYIDPMLTSLVPKVKPPQKQIPDVYADEEIKMMLDSIDTASPIGKRNMVVCLLATRLGMRAQDIAALSFDNLNWRENTIEFCALKTGRQTTLPLTNEIGEAIIAYVRKGRPEQTGEKYVLLRHEKPCVKLRASSVHYIVTKALNRAGIAIDGRRHGPHALRASLATRLMRNNTPLPVISEALSHENSDTTRLYLKVDIDKLRSCALEVKPLVNTWWKAGGA